MPVAIHVPLLQVIDGESGGPAFFHEGPESMKLGKPWEYSATKVKLGGKAVPGWRALAVLCVPIGWRARWVERIQSEENGRKRSRDGRSVPFCDGRPGETWVSRIQVLGYWSSIGFALLSTKGTSNPKWMSALHAYSDAAYDHQEAHQDKLQVLRLWECGSVKVSIQAGAVIGEPGPHPSEEVHSYVAEWLTRRGGDDAIARWEHSW